MSSTKSHQSRTALTVLTGPAIALILFTVVPSSAI
jgi:hypothetical protein